MSDSICRNQLKSDCSAIFERNFKGPRDQHTEIDVVPFTCYFQFVCKKDRETERASSAFASINVGSCSQMM